jgi:MFS family permease
VTRPQIPRNVFVLGIASFLTDVSTEMAYVVLPMFLITTLGASIAFVGLVEGIAETVASFGKMFSGWFSDKLRARKAIVVSGYSLSGLTRPLLAIAAAPWHVLCARFVDRVGKGLRTSPRDALIADSSDEGTKGKMFGFHRAMDHGGAITGSLAAYALLAAGVSNYRTIFWFAVIPAAFTVLALVAGVREIRPRGDQPVGSILHLNLREMNPVFRKYLIIVFLFTLGNSSDAFLILRARAAGLRDSQIPLLWAALHVCKALSVIPFGAMSDRMSRRTLILIGWLFYSAIYFGFAFATGAVSVCALFIIYGLFYGLTEGPERAWVSDLVPQERLGRAYGIYNFAISIGALPASLIMGVLWEKVSMSAAFLFGAVLALLAASALALLKINDRRL